jgi:hypothetical protein
MKLNVVINMAQSKLFFLLALKKTEMHRKNFLQNNLDLKSAVWLPIMASR